MNILAIGNSFSQDATRYLYDLAKAAGKDVTVVNLYIGGCSLSRHYRNMLSEERAYQLEYNGHRTGFMVSLKEALLNRDWDIVTVQQASHYSTNHDTYQPYLNELAAYIRRCAPKAKMYMHETWAYEQDSARLNTMMGYQDFRDMYRDLHAAYEQAAKDINAEGIIPCGTLLMALADQGYTVHRDTFHASYGLGRYALALMWLRVLTDAKINDLALPAYDEPVDGEAAAIVRQTIMKLLP